ALVLAGVAIVYAPWVAYTLSQNIQPAASFGLAGARAALQAPVIASHTLVADLVFWSTVCLAYLLIGSAPYLPVLMAFPFARVRAGDRRENFFAIALVLLAATFTATAIYYLSRLHADRSYIEGRYLMYLFPLLPVAAFLSVRRLRTLSTRMRVTLTWIALGASLVLLYGSYRMLISGSPLNLNPTFVNIAWVSPDVIAFTTNTLPLFGTLMRLLIFLLIVGAAIYTLAPRQTALVVTAVVVVAFLAGTGYLASRVEAGQAEAVHGKELAAEVEQVLARGGTAPVPIAVDKDVPIDQMTMISSLEFWQVPADAFSYSIVPSGQLDDSVFASEIVLTSAKYGDPAVSYQVGTTTYGIYLPGPHSAPAAAVQIVDFGPQNVTLGQSFNTQADGASALWFKTHNAKPGLVLVIGNDQLPTDFGSPELVSARVPQGKLNSPGWITLYLYDPQTGQRSNKVQLSVKP
ncbi:MAG: hypothetical protein M1482_10325, partial [Chloroflexi bacterium]|nr:hypothetical protein [Chloroflexota bacterium]